jgi:hypothetical protein
MNKPPKIPFLIPLFISLALLGGLGIFMGYSMLTVTAQNRKEYRRVIADANPSLVGESIKNSYNATQKREGVRKDLFYSQGCQRMQLCLQSETSYLQMEQTLDKNILIEKMVPVRCHIQEELFYRLTDGREAIMELDGRLKLRKSDSDEQKLSSSESANAVPFQRMIYFESEGACYSYASSQCNANNAKVVYYIEKGHQINLVSPPSDPILQGEASEIQFTFAEGKLNFKAKGFKAHLDATKEKL